MTVENEGRPTPEDKEAALQAKYSIITHQGSPELSDFLSSQTRRIMFDVFRLVYKAHAPNDDTALRRLSDDTKQIAFDLSDPQTQFVGLVNKTDGQLVGFSYTTPSTGKIKPGVIEHNLLNNEFRDSEMTIEAFNQREIRTAEVGWTMILEEHRGKGGWKRMMGALEDRLEATGKYDYTKRSVRTANDYANGKFKSYYGDRIVYEQRHGGNFGEQIYFRVALPHVALAPKA